MNQIITHLRAAISDSALLTEDADMAPYLVDWRGMFRGNALCIARPETVEEVAKVVQIATVHGVAVVPQGGNTGLAGGATPTGTQPQILLSLTRMNKIRAIDRPGMTISVEAGCVLQHAKEAVKSIGRQLPIGYASEGSATIGGMISTNAGGVNTLRYGTARQLVLGLEAVLADGSILSGMRNLRKDNAGYDWKQLLIGSEGTLGIVTAAVLKLVPQAHERCAAFVALDSPEAALILLEQLYDHLGDAINAFELMSFASLQRVVRFVGGRIPVSPSPWFVLIEVADHAPALAQRLEEALAESAEKGCLADAALSSSLAHLQEFWALRENIGEAERHAGRSVKHDVAVGVSDVPNFVQAATSAVLALSLDLDINAFGHVGDGNIHFNVLGSPNGETDKRINRTVHEIVARFNGSIAAEHGIGQYRADELALSKPVEEHSLMRRMKIALDPNGLLNPGKIFRVG